MADTTGCICGLVSPAQMSTSSSRQGAAFISSGCSARPWSRKCPRQRLKSSSLPHHLGRLSSPSQLLVCQRVQVILSVRAQGVPCLSFECKSCWQYLVDRLSASSSTGFLFTDGASEDAFSTSHTAVLYGRKILHAVVWRRR